VPSGRAGQPEWMFAQAEEKMTTSKRLTPADAMFLWGETPSTMMHVGALMPFSPPPHAPRDFLRKMVEDVKYHTRVESPWNLRLRHANLLLHPRQSWVVDERLDIDYHVRRSALPSPGDERELGVLVSRLHSNALDFTRPPWEMHLIEGLEGGRFAIYVKVHHALVDGYTGMKLLARSLSTDPDDRDTPPFFAVPPRRRSPSDGQGDGLIGTIKGLGQTAATGVGSTLALTKATANLELRRLRRGGQWQHLVGSTQAPRSILNGRIGRNRRFATQQYRLARLKEIGARRRATLNDVVLAVVGGGLRSYLSELGELPTKPLVGFLPVNVRSEGDEGGGTVVGAILATLGTDIVDPLERLDAIMASTRVAKAQMHGLSQQAALAYSAFLMSPYGLQALNAFAGFRPPVPLAFNVCVSNVPGPREPLYMRGSRLEASYPLSIPAHGVALNITLHSYADTLNFGFIGCRDTLPHLQRLAVRTGEALVELEEAVG
jgi:WS/DGAT/MGAT family acyltransferase